MIALIREHWKKEDYNQFINNLWSDSDSAYRTFQSGLIPECHNMIGIRIPQLRKYAKEIAKGNYTEYFQCCTTETHEEILLEGMVIGLLKLPYDKLIPLIERYIDKIDNWALCDCFCAGLKIVKQHLSSFYFGIQRYLQSDNPWHVRTGLVLLLTYYLNDEYIEKVFTLCDGIHTNHYYVKMAQAWLVSAAYPRFPALTFAYLKRCNLDDWTYHKAIQKIRESFRVKDEDKEFLAGMKRK